MFGQKTAIKPEPNTLNIGLDSHVTLNTIDAIHLELHPAFSHPTGNFLIKAVGRPESATKGIDVFSIYAANGEVPYLIEIESCGRSVNTVSIYQNVLTIHPASDEEWRELLYEITAREALLDEIVYERILGGTADNAELCKINEKIQNQRGEVDCENQVMLFERTVGDGGFKEKLKIAIETVPENQESIVSFYVGFDLHPSNLSILGN